MKISRAFGKRCAALQHNCASPFPEAWPSPRIVPGPSFLPGQP